MSGFHDRHPRRGRPIEARQALHRSVHEEGQDGVAVQANRSSETPRFEEDNARQFLCTRPRSRTTKAVEVDGVRVSLE